MWLVGEGGGAGQSVPGFWVFFPSNEPRIIQAPDHGLPALTGINSIIFFFFAKNYI